MNIPRTGFITNMTALSRPTVNSISRCLEIFSQKNFKNSECELRKYEK